MPTTAVTSVGALPATVPITNPAAAPPAAPGGPFRALLDRTVTEQVAASEALLAAESALVTDTEGAPPTALADLPSDALAVPFPFGGLIPLPGIAIEPAIAGEAEGEPTGGNARPVPNLSFTLPEAQSRAEELRLRFGAVPGRATVPQPIPDREAVPVFEEEPSTAPTTGEQLLTRGLTPDQALLAAPTSNGGTAPAGPTALVPAQVPIVADLTRPIPAPPGLPPDRPFPPPTPPAAAIAGLPSAVVGSRPGATPEYTAPPSPRSVPARSLEPVAGPQFPEALRTELGEPVAIPAFAPVRAGAADTLPAAQAVTPPVGEVVTRPGGIRELPVAIPPVLTRAAEPAPPMEPVPVLVEEATSVEPGPPAQPFVVPTPSPGVVGAARTVDAPAPPVHQVADRIVAHAGGSIQEGRVEFQMRLDPPELGRVRVELVFEGAELRGQVFVASDAVRQVVESQLPELRQRLEAAGVSVQGFAVGLDSGGGGGHSQRGWADPEAASAPVPTPDVPNRPQPVRTEAGGRTLDVMV